MKFLILACLAAAAVAEPWYPYAATYGAYPVHHLGYAAYGASGATVDQQATVHRSPAYCGPSGCQAAKTAVAGQLGSSTLYHLKKRSADAEAEADPALLYANNVYGYGLGYARYGYAARPVVSSYAAYPAYTSSVFANRLWKREAESDAEADPALLYSAGLPYAGYSGYAGLGYARYGYAARPVVSSYAAYPSLTTSLYANRLWKREAEADAEADPALLYSAGYPYATTYGYNSAVAYSRPAAYYPYSTWGYANANRFLW